MGLKSYAKCDAGFVVVIFVPDGVGYDIIRCILRIEVAIKQGCIFGESVKIGSIAIEHSEIQTESGGNGLQFVQIFGVFVGTGIIRVSTP